MIIGFQVVVENNHKNINNCKLCAKEQQAGTSILIFFI